MTEPRFNSYPLYTYPRLAVVLAANSFIQPVEDVVYTYQGSLFERPLEKINGRYFFMLGSMMHWRMIFREEFGTIERALDYKAFTDMGFEDKCVVEVDIIGKGKLVMFVTRPTEDLYSFEYVLISEFKDRLLFSTAINDAMDISFYNAMQALGLIVRSAARLELVGEDVLIHPEFGGVGLHKDDVTLQDVTQLMLEASDEMGFTEEITERMLTAIGHYAITDTRNGVMLSHRFHNNLKAKMEVVHDEEPCFFHIYLEKKDDPNKYWLDFIWFNLEEQIAVESIVARQLYNF